MAEPDGWELKRQAEEAGREKGREERRKFNEHQTFAIASLQTASAATAFGFLSKFELLSELAGRATLMVSLTGAVAALALGVFSSFSRYQSGLRRSQYTFEFASLWLGSWLFVSSLLLVVVGMWFHA